VSLALTVGGPDLVIRSSSSCPSAPAVAAEIAPLLPAGVHVAVGTSDRVTEDETDRVEVFDQHGSHWVRLTASDGRVNDERVLPVGLSCAQAARAVAVLVAAWQFQGRSDLPQAPSPPITPPPAPPPVARATATTPPPERKAAPPPSPVSPPSPVPPPAPAAQPETPRPAAPPPVAGDVAQTTAPTKPSSARRLSLGAGFAVGRAASQFPLDAMMELQLGPAEGVGLRLFATRSSRYSLAVATGRATWTRTSLGVGGVFTGRSGPWGGQGHAELVGALLSIAGEGFAVNEDSHQYALGGAIGGRVTRQAGPAELWLDLTLNVWPGRNQVYLRDAADSLDLSTFEVWLGLGADFLVWP